MYLEMSTSKLFLLFLKDNLPTFLFLCVVNIWEKKQTVQKIIAVSWMGFDKDDALPHSLLIIIYRL